MAMVWNTNLSTTGKIVLLFYADKASDDGSGIWPSVNTVCQKTGLTRRTIQRITKELTNDGYLQLEGWSKYHTKLMNINLKKLKKEGGDNE